MMVFSRRINPKIQVHGSTAQDIAVGRAVRNRHLSLSQSGGRISFFVITSANAMYTLKDMH